MSIKLSETRPILNEILQDIIEGTTTDAGAADKKTLIDESLCQYEDNWFQHWTVYLTSSTQERKIDSFLATEGQLRVRYPFTSLVAASTKYELARFSASEKKIKLNEALRDSWPYFYKRLDDVTLTGKGSSDTEYSVPTAFTEFPQQVYVKYVSGSQIYYSQCYGIDFKDVGGNKKFYADIPTGKTILLIGKTYLTQFTTETSTTELDNAQARIVCFGAAANLYRGYSAIVNSQLANRFDALASYYESKFRDLVENQRMPSLQKMEINWSWLS